MKSSGIVQSILKVRFDPSTAQMAWLSHFSRVQNPAGHAYKTLTAPEGSL